MTLTWRHLGFNWSHAVKKERKWFMISGLIINAQVSSKQVSSPLPTLVFVSKTNTCNAMVLIIQFYGTCIEYFQLHLNQNWPWNSVAFFQWFTFKILLCLHPWSRTMYVTSSLNVCYTCHPHLQTISAYTCCFNISYLQIKLVVNYNVIVWLPPLLISCLLDLYWIQRLCIQVLLKN